MEELKVKPEKRIRWSMSDRIKLTFVILGFIVTALWFAFPTSFFIKPVSLTIEGREGRFVRETPYGLVAGRWRSEITLIDGDGFECSTKEWKLEDYQPIKGNAVTFNLGPWADDCIEAGPPFYLTTTRQVLLFGFIPLREDRQRTEILGETPRGQTDEKVNDATD
jgi:hypothetical protein